MSFYKNKSTVFQLPSPICWYKIISNPLLYLLVNMNNVERCCCVCGREGIYLNLFLSTRFFEISADLIPHKAELRTYRLKVPRLQMKAFLSAGFLFVYRIWQNNSFLDQNGVFSLKKTSGPINPLERLMWAISLFWSFEKPLKKNDNTIWENLVMTYLNITKWWVGRPRLLVH